MAPDRREGGYSVTQEKPLVGLVYGSPTDKELADACGRVLDYFGVPFQSVQLSAHRDPEGTSEYADRAEESGLKVLIAIAGMAAHLAGALAARSTLPVIAVPAEGAAFAGMDSLLSAVQMPAGVPVATVAVGTAGAKNAAVLAAQMLALADEALAERIRDFKKEQAKKKVI
jgi:5-(carboxyamino)imidazole ribonucleotide mutase